MATVFEGNDVVNFVGVYGDVLVYQAILTFPLGTLGYQSSQGRRDGWSIHLFELRTGLCFQQHHKKLKLLV